MTGGSRRALALAACGFATAVLAAEPPPTLAPFSAAAAAQPPAAWRLVTLPAAKKIPATLLEIAGLDGERRLRLQSDGSYGALVHLEANFRGMFVPRMPRWGRCWRSPSAATPNNTPDASWCMGDIRLRH